MAELAKEVLYHGKGEPLPEQRELRAGPLSLLYEAGDLRYIRFGDREIVRRIYVAVRDRNWLTVPMKLSNLQLEAQDNSFCLSFTAEHKEGDIDFTWQGTVTGDARGTIRYRMAGEARSTFLRNRIGICVLHPVEECAGQRCRLERISGELEFRAFPEAISPHQPFTDMRAVSHEVAPDVWAEVRFEGDTFEMEDQRNWTDASFKTYSTPLALPFPVEVKAGTAIKQAVELRLIGQAPREKTSSRKAITLTAELSRGVPLPRIGLGTASHGGALSERELERLRALNLSHLRVDLRLSTPYEASLRQRVAEAKALGLALELALFLSDEADHELRTLVRMLKQLKPEVCRWLIFHEGEATTSERWLTLARELLSPYAPAAGIGGGTNAYFADLNRNRPPVEALDLVSYAINPQVHAFDNASLVETLEGQAATVASARRFVGDKPLAISPVTLKPRFLPTATAPEVAPAADDLPRQVDARQMSLFGAGWTLGSIKTLAQSGVQSLTYYETTGWRGVMETEAGSPLPQRFRSFPGSVFPVYHLLADIGEFAGGEVIPTASSHPLLLQGLMLRKCGKTRLLLANMSPDRQTVTLEIGARVSFLASQGFIRHLNETNALKAMRLPEPFRAQRGARQRMAGELELHLLPYALVRIDNHEGG